MIDETKMTAVDPSVGPDEGRSRKTCIERNITDEYEEIKDFEEIQKDTLKAADSSCLNTVSMTELLDSVYQSSPPVIDGLLYRGMYLFAGAPKLGKSFLMSQLAYHVSTGAPLWGFHVHAEPAITAGHSPLSRSGR